MIYLLFSAADYSGIPATLTFDSDTTSQSFSLMAMDDDVVEEGETFTLSLSSTDLLVNTSSTTEITIVDNDS